MSKSFLSRAVLFGMVALFASNFAPAVADTVLHSFPKNSQVQGEVTAEGSNTLYGTTRTENKHGTVYQLTRQNGKWITTTIHVFNGNDGSQPWAGVTVDAATGTLYGTTIYGGAYNKGTIFSLTPSDGGWTETVLHSFDGANGAQPEALLTRDKTTGVLYGTTANTEPGCGTAFRFDPASGQFSLLYKFQGNPDGCLPQAQLQQDAESGVFFGVTGYGGSYDYGTVFQLRDTAGSWTESVLYSFRRRDGIVPIDITAPAPGLAHRMYGVANDAGPNYSGTVFQLSNSNGKWNYRVIYTFPGDHDGIFPIGLCLDRKSGTLYGTTEQGGLAGLGTVFALQNVGGTWAETILQNFSGEDGRNPFARPLYDHRRQYLYGTTSYGGTKDGGVVYAVKP